MFVSGMLQMLIGEKHVLVLWLAMAMIATAAIAMLFQIMRLSFLLCSMVRISSRNRSRLSILPAGIPIAILAMSVVCLASRMAYRGWRAVLIGVGLLLTVSICLPPMVDARLPMPSRRRTTLLKRDTPWRVFHSFHRSRERVF